MTAPEAVAVATASAAGVPAARMVLLKQFDERGFVFYTNYESRKGRELEANPVAALLFYWELLGRQIRIEGPVERTSPKETAAYVRTRARGSQLSALASPQSRVVSGRAELEERIAQIADSFEDSELPLPEAWGGFRLRPKRYEFWQGRAERLHDRILYLPGDEGSWRMERLAP